MISAKEPVTTSEDLFLMANLHPKHTGLPFVVWISTGQGAQHDVRVKVSHGPRAHPSDFVSVAVCPDIRVMRGALTPDESERLSRWISLNLPTILAYWSEEIDTADTLAQIRKIDQ